MKTLHNCLNKPLLAILLCLSACKKEADLNEIPDSTLLVIKDLTDAQAILDNTTIMRETPALPEISSDNFYLLSDAALNTLDPVEKNAYLWNIDIFTGTPPADDWFRPYKQIYYANSILDVLPRLSDKSDEAKMNQIKGSALFIRAYNHFNVVLEFAQLYGISADTDPGIPIKLTPDPELPSPRATVKETYDQILKDITGAVKLLPPDLDPGRKNRPSLPAAYALLARIYLFMGEYQNAKHYADSCLALYSTLMDYNSFSNAASNPFEANNAEVLYQTNLFSKTGVFLSNSCFIDSTLYASFSGEDLRKQLFFKVGSSGLPQPGFSYSGDLTRFSGLAIDEVMLMRAECNARLGNKDAALQDVVTLLKKRWKNGAYTPPAISSADDVLRLVLQERRKELVFRGLRWIDIRRLNKITSPITLKRLIDKKEYTLPPGDNRYVMPIPPEVIAFNTGMPQNPRP